MAQPRLKFTRADLELLPDELRVELIDGQLLKMPAPTVSHQEVVRSLFLALIGHVAPERVLFGPVGFVIDEWNVLVPDLVALERQPDREAKSLQEAQLIVEVLSPSTAKRDRTVKTDLYLSVGVDEVWLVDRRTQVVEMRTAGSEETARSGDVARSKVLPGFAIAVQDLFR